MQSAGSYRGKGGLGRVLLGLFLTLDAILVGMLMGLRAERDGLAVGDPRCAVIDGRIEGILALRLFLAGLFARVLAARAFAAAGGPLTLRRLYGRLRMIARAEVARQLEERWAVSARVVRVRPRRAARVARRRRPTDKVTQKTARGAG